MYKLVANSAYGRMIMNMDRRRNHKILKTTDHVGRRKLRRITANIPLHGEYASGYSEIETKPIQITDKIPVHCGFYVLQNSKLHFLRCLSMLYEYCDVEAFRLIYVDTG